MVPCLLAIVEMLIRNNKQILNRLRFFKILLVAIPISLLVYFVNESIIANIVKLNTLTILLYYLPFFLLTAIGFIWFMQKRLEINILQKLFKRFKNGQ